MPRLRTTLAFTTALALLPALLLGGAANASPARGAASALGTKLTRVAFSVKTVHGRHSLTVKANVKVMPGTTPLVIRDAGTNKKLRSCNVVAKCNLILPTAVQRVYATTKGFRSANFTVWQPALTRVSFNTSLKNKKLYISVKGNTANAPAKTALYVRDAGSRKVLARCTVVVKCSFAPAKGVKRIYATWGKRKSATYTIKLSNSNDAFCKGAQAGYNVCYPYDEFSGITLKAQSSTITPPLAGSEGPGQGAIAVSTGTDILTISNIPSNAEFRKYNLGLYLFEVNDRDAAIGQATTDLVDGHLMYTEDASGNPTFTLYAWNGDDSHTYVAAVGIENRYSPGVYTEGEGSHTYQPTFANFLSDQGALTYGNPVLLSNPVIIKPAPKHWGLNMQVAHNQSTEELQPWCGCAWQVWATSAYTTYQMVAASGLRNYGDNPSADHTPKLWENFYNDPEADLDRYRKFYENAGALGVGMDAQENAVLSDKYPDLDGTWSYDIYGYDNETGSGGAMDPRDNAGIWKDDNGSDSGYGYQDTHSHKFYYARSGDGGLFDVRAATGSSDSHPIGGGSVPVAPCNPDTTTKPVGSGGWNSMQSRYAIGDALTGGAVSRLYDSLGSDAVDHCSAEYKITSGALTALSFATPLKVSDVTAVAQAERLIYSKSSKYSTLFVKLSDPRDEVRNEAAAEFVKDCAKDNVKENAVKTGYDLLNKYYEDHPPASGITPVFGDPEDNQVEINYCVG